MQQPSVAETLLKVELIHKEPVDVASFAESLNSLASHYRHFVIQNSLERIGRREGRLHITRIENGSIVAYLIDNSPIIWAGVAVLDGANTIIDFVKHLKEGYAKFLRRDKQKRDNLNKTAKELRDLNRIIEPVAEDKSNQLNIGAVTINNLVIENLHLNGNDAASIQSAIVQELKKINVGSISLHTLLEGSENQRDLTKMPPDLVTRSPFRWKLIDSDLSGKGIIESISNEPVDVRFLKGELAQKMLGEKNINPIQSLFIVDAFVDYEGGKPVTYTIKHVHHPNSIHTNPPELGISD